MASEHYFSSAPGSDLKLRKITVMIAGSPREVTTANAIFSPEHIDTGTKVLIRDAPLPTGGGDILDLGSGWGPISLHLALADPSATVWAVDVNERALDLVRMNAASLGLTNINAVLPGDVPDSVVFGGIWSNPPIRVGKAELHSMLAHWLPRLAADADAWLVVQRNLGSDSLQRWLADEFPDTLEVSRYTADKGFRVLRAHKSAQPRPGTVS
jgi:16S rRNA (guanine1207-N2)-methyltransferase